MNFFSMEEKPKRDNTKTEESGSTKAKEIRKISGHDSIGDVASSAPASVGPDLRSSTKSATGAISTGATGKKATKQELEAQEKAKLRAEARDRVGRYWAKRLTNIPYDTWARVLQDNDMRLTDDEAKELAEDLFMTIDAFDIDPSNKWVLLGALMFTHGSAVSARINILRKKDAAATAEAESTAVM